MSISGLVFNTNFGEIVMDYFIDWEALRNKTSEMLIHKDYILVDVPEEIVSLEAIIYNICCKFQLRWNDRRNNQHEACGFRIYWNTGEGNSLDTYSISVFESAGFRSVGKLSDYVTYHKFNFDELLDLLEV